MQKLIGVEGIKFSFNNDENPDPALLHKAKEITQDFDIFQENVQAFLNTEAQKYEKKASGEIQNLIISVIMIAWPDKPNNAMIFFSGPNKDHVWHCDYDFKTFSSLTYDS